MKRAARHLADVAAACGGMLGWLERRACAGVTILMYHRVLPEPLAPRYPLGSLVVPATMFERQMRWLASHCEVLTLDRAMQRSTLPARQPTVCVTFDDGYADNAEVAAPILESLGLRATFFITSGFVESGEPLWFDRAAWQARSASREALLSAARSAAGEAEMADMTVGGWMQWMKSLAPQQRAEVIAAVEAQCPMEYPRDLLRPMVPQQVRQLASQGHEIGSHTVSHPLLPQLGHGSLMSELVESRRRLQQWSGAPADSFCYPNGDHDDRICAAVAEAGYRWACTTRRGINLPGAAPLRLSRRGVMPSSVAGPAGGHWSLAFRAEIWGWHDRLRGRESQAVALQPGAVVAS